MHVQDAKLATLADHLIRHTEAWQAVDARVRALHATLAELPGGDPDTWDELVAASDARDTAARALGSAVGRWVALGGSLELVDPDDAAAAPATGETAGDEAIPETPADEDAAPEVAPPGPPAPAPEPDAATTAPEAPAPEGPAPRRASPPTPEALTLLATHGLGGAKQLGREALSRQARHHLDALVQLVDHPVTVPELARIAAWMEHVDLLAPLPDADVRLALTALIARLRALQVHHDGRKLDDLVPRLRGWLDRRRPGFVHGLARDHRPEHGGWSHDAERALQALRGAPSRTAPEAPTPESLLQALADGLVGLPPAAWRARLVDALAAGLAPDDRRLVRLVADRYDDLKGDGRLARLRKAVKDRHKADRAAAPATKDAPPADWPFWHLTRGKVAVIVGGDPRAANRDRIKEAFGFARVEWPEHDYSLLDRLAERVRNGTVDVLLVNRFGGHDIDDVVLAEVRDDLSRWVRIDHGYGVSGVRTAMEGHWQALAVHEA